MPEQDFFEDPRRPTPVRRDFVRTVKRDGQDNLIVTDITAKLVYLSDGSIDTTELGGFYGCGCPTTLKPVGNSCFECHAVSCAECGGRCSQCLKPLCLQHSFFLPDAAEQSLRFCRRCYQDEKRGRLIGKIFGLLPFGSKRST